MRKKNLLLRFILLSLGLLPFIFIAIILIPGVQKYLVENQLTPWLSQASVDSIQITPFSIEIKNLKLKYEAIDIQIDNIDSKFSPLSLFSQRIKIDKLILNKLQIDDASPADEKQKDSKFIFYGLFPYFDTGFVYDIGVLDIDVKYNSSATGQVHVSLNAHAINENTNNPILLKVTARSLSITPDIQGILLDSSIRLNQTLTRPINAHQSQFNVTLFDSDSAEQHISIQLDMDQLAKPDKWAAFPFDKYRTHYLPELLHPESIALKIKHTNSDAKVLSNIQFNGQYNGNEGVISGALKILTDKTLTRQFKSLALPEIESKVSATLKYNLRRLEGYIDLVDEFNVEDYLKMYTVQNKSLQPDKSLQPGKSPQLNQSHQPGKSHQPDKSPQPEEKIKLKHSSLPEQFNISNHLSASISNNKLLINSFLLKILSNGQEYINIYTHKPLSINLEHLSDFFEQKNADLLRINIHQLPLTWFNDFTSDYQIKEGFLDTDINLELENKTLKLSSNRPFSFKNVSVIEPTNSIEKTEQPKQSGNKNQEEIPTNQVLLLNQNLEADFLVSINNKNLNSQIKQLKLYQTNKNNKVLQQLDTSLALNIEDPIQYLEQEKKPLPPVLSVQSKGLIDLHALTKIPYIFRLLDPKSKIKIQADSVPALLQSFPKALSLNYEVKVDNKINKQSAIWDIKQSTINFFGGKNTKNASQIFTLKNAQNIQFNQDKEHFELLTEGSLIAAKISQFNINWLSSLMTQYVPAYKVSGELSQMNLLISSQKQTAEQPEKTNKTHFLVDINPFILSKLEAYEDKKQLFSNIKINTKIHANYSPEKITINYPSLSIKKNTNILVKNSGSLIINNPGDEKKQILTIKGKLKGFIHHIMKLSLIKQYTQTNMALNQESLLDAQYHLKVTDKNLTVNKSKFEILHTKSKGRLILTTPKPISLSLKDKKHNFSKNGHLSFKLINFDINPYESIFSEVPISFDFANAHFDLIQTKKNQQIIMREPLVIHNIHYKDKEKRLLEPFDITLNFTAAQHKNVTTGEIKQLSINFLNSTSSSRNKTNALDFSTDFKLDLDKEIILSELNGNLDLMITQWLNQPMSLPHNTLSQGTLNTQFSINKNRKISHKWLISNLVDNKNKQLVESISINGTGQLHSPTDFSLDLPIIMKSISGESNLLLKAKTLLQVNKNQLSMDIEGKEIFLNDLFKLLAAINPQSEISKLENTEEEKQATADKQQSRKNSQPLDKTPAAEPFWKSGLDISAKLKIDQLFYSDYMSYQDITGELFIDDKQLHAKGLQIKFHESPMKLDALLKFDSNKQRPYNIKFNTSLSQFKVGEFLQELNPEHVPRADGVFDVNIDIYGPLSNLSQFRNELLFNLNIEGKNGVYHLIPSNDVMMRSSGAAMAVVGEVVSVIPTSGFGLGIVNRVIRFTKDINYDVISMHLTRQSDLHTTIDKLQIISPELHLFATGGLTFVQDTRLFDQPLEMTAQLDLAGEGAAIFYGLGLLNDEQDEYGFWKGPIIKFSGTLNHQNDNFDKIISKAKSGTVVGGITNPFSGLIGNFKYRWFGDAPNYNKLKTENIEEKAMQTSPKKNIPKETTPILKQQAERIVEQRETQKAQQKQNSSFFDETF